MKYDFEEIYREHFHVVYMYVLGLSGDCKIAEDIAQESFARAIKHIIAIQKKYKAVDKGGKIEA